MTDTPTPESSPEPSTDAAGQTADTKKASSKKDSSKKATSKKSSKESEDFTPRDITVMLGIVAVSLAVPVIWKSGLGILSAVEWLVRDFTWVIVLVGLPLAALAVVSSRREQRRKELGKPSLAAKDPLMKRLGHLGAVLTAVIALSVAYGFLVHPWLKGRAYASVSSTVNEQTSYADRAPWVVANNFAQRDQGDVIGDRLNVSYVPTSQDAKAEAGDGAGKGSSRYSVLVKERGMLGTGGYAAVQTLSMPTTGVIPSGASTYCAVPDSMNMRLGSWWPWHSLSWEIHAKAPFSHWDPDDSYGYCSADGTPHIVVPLFGYDGFWTVVTAPKGAAVYTPDGVEVLSPEELNKRGIEGPTYPQSVARTQRESINAGGSLTDWWGSKYGYDLTNEDEDGDEEDTNAENSSEFTLITSDTRELRYITPLTPRGSSQSITATSSVPARVQHAGLHPLVINTKVDLPATSTLETSIKESSVRGDNAWTTRWASGMRVYEILPAQDGHWVASIGQGQAVSYRADIAPDGTVRVVNAETGQSSAGPSASSQEAGADAGSSQGEAVVRGGKPLSEMSDAELLNLIGQATEELKKREAAQ